MKIYLSLLMIMLCAFAGYGQTASPSPEESKTFGSSLDRYKNRKKPEAQAAKSDAQIGDGDVIRVKTDLVVSDVLITDQNGKIISNLKRDDFIVTEDGAPQTIEIFSGRETSPLPRSIVFLVDYGGEQIPYFSKSIEAAKLLVDKLSPEDKMAIVTNDVKLRIGFTKDKALLKNELDMLERKGAGAGSGLEFDSLLAVLNELFTAADRRRIVIFQGDGNEIIWLKRDKDFAFKVSDYTMEHSGSRYSRWRPFLGFSDVREALERSQTTVYSVVTNYRYLGLPKKIQIARAKQTLEDLNRDFIKTRSEYVPRILNEFEDAEVERNVAGQTAMSKVAEISGGYLGFIEKPEDAEDVYSDIFNQIENRYTIGYYSATEKPGTEINNIKIAVRDHPEYIITGRKSSDAH